MVRHVERATFRCVDRGIRVGRLGFFKPPEDPEFLEATGLIRFGLKRNTLGEWLRSSQRPVSGRLRAEQVNQCHDARLTVEVMNQCQARLDLGLVELRVRHQRPVFRIDIGRGNPVGARPLW